MNYLCLTQSYFLSLEIQNGCVNSTTERYGDPEEDVKPSVHGSTMMNIHVSTRWPQNKIQKWKLLEFVCNRPVCDIFLSVDINLTITIMSGSSCLPVLLKTTKMSFIDYQLQMRLSKCRKFHFANNLGQTILCVKQSFCSLLHRSITMLIFGNIGERAGIEQFYQMTVMFSPFL